MASVLQQGLELLVYGMGTVLLFLSLLVVATRVMSAVVTRWLPEPPTTLPVVDVPAPANPGAQVSPEIVAAITVALARHRAGPR